MRVSMAAIIHRARWNFNVDEADGVNRRHRRPESRELRLPEMANLGVAFTQGVVR